MGGAISRTDVEVMRYSGADDRREQTGAPADRLNLPAPATDAHVHRTGAEPVSSLTPSERRVIEARIAGLRAALRDLEARVQRLRQVNCQPDTDAPGSASSGPRRI